jgi:pimeloyl-ACP methyl ester carboxylesterase
VWSSGDVALTEAQMKKSDRFVEGEFRYERIEGASHWIQLDAPEELAALLVAHFSASEEVAPRPNGV